MTGERREQVTIDTRVVKTVVPRGGPSSGYSCVVLDGPSGTVTVSRRLRPTRTLRVNAGNVP